MNLESPHISLVNIPKNGKIQISCTFCTELYTCSVYIDHGRGTCWFGYALQHGPVLYHPMLER